LPLSAAREKSKTLFTTIGAEDEVDLSPTAQVAGHKRTFCDVRVMRFTPESGHFRTPIECALSANTATRLSSDNAPHVRAEPVVALLSRVARPAEVVKHLLARCDVSILGCQFLGRRSGTGAKKFQRDHAVSCFCLTRAYVRVKNGRIAVTGDGCGGLERSILN
jgi:hypothetical protein